MDIILASQSPRRRMLLEQMGVKGFQIVSPEIDERVEGSPTPERMVEELSRRKAAAVASRIGGEALIVAADTVVVLDGAVLGKPQDREEAFAMLSALSGKRHHVYTGVTVGGRGRAVTWHEVTSVTFRGLAAEEIRGYIATGEPMDKAGAYGIQGLGALMVSGIEGDYYNVMGLPVCSLGRVLAEEFEMELLRAVDLRRGE